jgi:hypothetical protein
MLRFVEAFLGDQKVVTLSREPLINPPDRDDCRVACH